MANVLLNSEVVAQIVQEKMKGKVKMLGLASDFGVLDNGVQQGDTYQMHKFSALTKAVDLVKGEQIPLEDIKATKSTERIRHVGKGFQVYDVEKHTTVGGQSLIDIYSEQVAEVMIREMELDLGTKALKAPLKFATLAKDDITADEINQAIQMGFADNQDVEDMSIIVNSRLAPKFFKMEEFISSGITHTTEKNGVVVNGVLGAFRGIPVIVTDLNTYVDDECVTFILKDNALGYKKVKDTNIEVARDASRKADNVYADLLFVTGVTDDTKIIVVRNTIA